MKFNRWTKVGEKIGQAIQNRQEIREAAKPMATTVRKSIPKRILSRTAVSEYAKARGADRLEMTENA